MLFRTARLMTVLIVATAAAGCGGLFPQKYEYVEEIALDVDGSAVVSLSASEAALVALRGAPLDAGPHAVGFRVMAIADPSRLVGPKTADGAPGSRARAE